MGLNLADMLISDIQRDSISAIRCYAIREWVVWVFQVIKIKCVNALYRTFYQLKRIHFIKRMSLCITSPKNRYGTSCGVDIDKGLRLSLITHRKTELNPINE